MKGNRTATSRYVVRGLLAVLAVTSVVALSRGGGADTAAAARARDATPLVAANLIPRATFPMLSADSGMAPRRTVTVEPGANGAPATASATTDATGAATVADPASGFEYDITVQENGQTSAGVQVGVAVAQGRVLVVASDPTGTYAPELTVGRIPRADAAETQVTAGLKAIPFLINLTTFLDALSTGKEIRTSGLNFNFSDLAPFTTNVPLVGGFAGTTCLTPDQLVAASHLAFLGAGIGAGLVLTLVTDGASAPLIPVLSQAGLELGSDLASWLVDQSILSSGENFTVKLGILEAPVLPPLPLVEIARDNCGKPTPTSHPGSVNVSVTYKGSPVSGACVFLATPGQNPVVVSSTQTTGLDGVARFSNVPIGDIVPYPGMIGAFAIGKAIPGDYNPDSCFKVQGDHVYFSPLIAGKSTTASETLITWPVQKCGLWDDARGFCARPESQSPITNVRFGARTSSPSGGDSVLVTFDFAFPGSGPVGGYARPYSNGSPSCSASMRKPTAPVMTYPNASGTGSSVVSVGGCHIDTIVIKLVSAAGTSLLDIPVSYD